ncbi:expressed protein [Phakopsora pachyrhizi]|uniref:Expressed protein n=1 Tax=Phakopsora pachyrhizi TaxID=170000 RepID=A0AAV0AG49_PHAPC|nr:expressed protein [Phakopsora pachyrhizi]
MVSPTLNEYRLVGSPSDDLSDIDLSSNHPTTLQRWYLRIDCLIAQIRSSFAIKVICSISSLGLFIILIKIGTSNYDQLSSEYNPESSSSSLTLSEQNGDCRKTMLYQFTSPYGLFSELLMYNRYASLGRSLGYTILIDDSYWNQGKLSDYFDIKYPDCSKRLNASTIERKLHCDKGMANYDHVIARRQCVDLLDSEVYSKIDPEFSKLESVWKFINQRNDLTTLPTEQNLNFRVKSIFDAQASELLRVWKPNSQIKKLVSDFERAIDNSNFLNEKGGRGSTRRRKTIGLHFRLGDKVEEVSLNQYIGGFGIPPGFGNPSRHIQKLLDLANDHRWLEPERTSFFSRFSKKTINVVTISDNIDDALNRLEGHKKSFINHPLPMNFMGLAKYRNSSTDSPIESGHKQSEFNNLPMSEKIKRNQAVLSEVEYLVRNTDGIICSMASNVCNALMLLSGSHKIIDDVKKNKRKSFVRSVDHRWFATSYYRESKTLKTDEAINLGLKFSKDYRNHVDL